MKKYISIIFLLLLSFLLVSCSKDQSEENLSSSDVVMETTVSPTPTPVPYPQQVLIANGDVEFDYIIDGFFFVEGMRQNTIDLKYNYQPKDINIAEEIWSSSDESVAKVNDKGVVTAVGIGTCIIDLHVSDGLSSGANTSITVTVKDGVKQISGESYPSYDEILDYVEMNLKDSADSFNYNMDENYNETDDGFIYKKGDLTLMCSNKDCMFFIQEELDEDYLSVFNSYSSPYNFGQLDGMLISFNCYRIDYYFDEYHFIAMNTTGDFSDCFPLFVDMGFFDPTDYIEFAG